MRCGFERVKGGSRRVGIEVFAERVGGDGSVVRAKEVMEMDAEGVDVLVWPLVD